jgi:hypothetical protein
VIPPVFFSFLKGQKNIFQTKQKQPLFALLLIRFCIHPVKYRLCASRRAVRNTIIFSDPFFCVVISENILFFFVLLQTLMDCNCLVGGPKVRAKTSGLLATNTRMMYDTRRIIYQKKLFYLEL